HAQDLARETRRPRRAIALDTDVDPVAAVLKARVPEQRARQKSGLAEDLETVARSEHRLSVRGEAAQLFRRGRDLRDRAGPQVVAVREAAGNDRDIKAAEVGVLVPDDLRLDVGDERERVLEVPLAPRARVAEERDARHAGCASFTSYS